jgi:hypothetical protein
MLRFKDMFPYGIEYRPGEDELVNYRALRRKRTIGVGEGGPIGESVEEVDEALTPTQRRARSRLFKKYKAKIKLGQERARRKVASPEVLKNRARKAARVLILKKLTKGLTKDELTFARRQEFEKRLETPAAKKKIENLAKKLMPQIRKREMERKRGGSKE